MAKPHLEVLGTLTFHDSEGAPVHLPTRKAELLLAILALSPGQRATRARLAVWLWPDADETQAVASFRKALSWLKAALPRGAILSRRNEVRLAADAISVDAMVFEAAIDEDSDESLDHAVNLYRGDLLDGIEAVPGSFEEWVMFERVRLRDRLEQGLRRLFDRKLTDRQFDAAAGVARRLIALDPYDEAGHQALLKVLMIQGKRRRAEAHLLATKAQFREELGIEPSATMTSMVHGLSQRIEPNASGARGLTLSAAIHPGAIQIEVPLIRSVAGQSFVRETAAELSEAIAKDLALDGGLRVLGPLECSPATCQSGTHVRLVGGLNRVNGAWHLAVNLSDPTGQPIWADCLEFIDVNQPLAMLRAAARRAVGRILATESLARKQGQDLHEDGAANGLLELAVSLLSCLDGGGNQISRGIFDALIDEVPNNGLVQAWAGFCDFVVWYLMLDGVDNKLFDDAVRKTQRAVRLSPGAPLAHEMLGWNLLKASRTSDGLFHCRVAIGLSPHDPAAWKRYGASLIEAGKIHEGLELLAREDGITDPSKSGQIWLKGYGYFALGDYETAANVIASAPGSSLSYEAWRAAAYVRTGQETKAREQAGKFHDVAGAMGLKRPKIGPDSFVRLILDRENITRTYMAEDFRDAVQRVGIR